MHTSQKKGLRKSLIMIFVVILAGILMLTGCSDKEARQSATNAANGAANAQTSADAAKAAADAAQAAADAAADQAKANSDAIAGLPDDEAVAASINAILSEYVKGDLAADSILSNAEITTLLGEYAKLSALTSYALKSDLTPLAKAVDVTALSNTLATAKTELTTTLGNYYLKNETFTKAEVTSNIAAAVEGLIKISDVEAAITARLANYDTSDVVTQKLSALSTQLDGQVRDLLTTTYTTTVALNTKLEEYAKLATLYTELGKITNSISAVDGKFTDYYNSAAVDKKLADLEESIESDFDAVLSKEYATLETLDDRLEEYSTTVAINTMISTYLGDYYDSTEINAKLLTLETALKKDLSDYIASVYSNEEIDAKLTEIKTTLNASIDEVKNSVTALGNNVYNKTEVDNALATLKTELNGNLDAYKVEANAKLAELQTGLDNVYTKTVIEAKLEALKDELNNSLNDYIGSVYSDATIDSKLETLKTELNVNINAVKERVTALENGVYTKAEIDTALATLKTELNGNINTVKDSVAALTNNVYTKAEIDTALATLKTELNDSIDTLKESVYTKTEIDTKLTALETALKTEVNSLEALLTSEYATLTALDNSLTAYAKTAAVNTLLESYAKTEAVNALLENYVKTDVFDTYKTDVTGEFTAVKADIAAINAKLDAINTSVFEAIKAQIEDIADEAVAAYVVAYESATDYIEATGLPTLDAKIAEYKANGYLYTAEDLAGIIYKLETSKLLLLRMQTVEAAEEFVAEAIDIAADAKNIAQLLADALDAVTRPIVAPIGTEEEVANNEITKCEELLALAVAQITDATEFAEKINAYVDGEATRDLQKETETYRAYYELMLLAKAGAPAVVTAIDAIPFYNHTNANYDDLKVDDCVWNAEHSAIVSGDRFDFTSKLTNSVNYIDGANWYDTYMSKFGEAFEADDDANLAKLIPNHDKYVKAIARYTALGALDVAAAEMNSEAFELLKAAGYFVYDEVAATQITTGKAAYTSYDALKAHLDEIDAWCTEQGVTVKTNPIPYYDDLVAATAYAEDMDELFDEATTAETGIIAILDAIIAKLPGMALSNEAEVVDARNALDAFEAEFAGDDANFKAIVNYVPAESELYAGSTRIAEFEKCEARIDTLKDAKAAAEIINAEITTLETAANINSMPAIRTIRNTIVTWLNTYHIVATPIPEGAVPTDNPILYWINNAEEAKSDIVLNKEEFFQYVAENFTIDIAKLDAIFDKVDDLLMKAIDDANTNVIPSIEAIITNEGKLLYQYNAQQKAIVKYNNWASKYFVTNVDLETYDFGVEITGTAAEAAGVLIEKYLEFNDKSTLIKAELMNAQTDYLAIESDIDAIEAIETVKLQDVRLIVDTYKAVVAWVEKYLDATKYPEIGYPAADSDDKALLESIVYILTEAEYNTVVDAHNKYTELLNTAIAEATLENTGVLPLINALPENPTIYDGDSISGARASYNTWATKYGFTDVASLTAEDWTNGAAEPVSGTTISEDMAEALAALIAIETKYNALVTELVGKLSDINTAMAAFNAAPLTVYTRQDLATALNTFFDWVNIEKDGKKVGLNVIDNGFIAAFEGVDDEVLKAFGASTEPSYDAITGDPITDEQGKPVLVATILAKFEAKYKELLKIEAAKQVETADVEGLIAKLGTITEGTVALVDGFNTSNRDDLDAAKAAYDAWLAGAKFEGIVLDADSYKVRNDQTDYPEACTYEVDNFDVLTAALAQMALIDIKLKAATDAIEAIATKYIDKDATQTEIDDLKAAIDAAQIAIDEFYQVNGGSNDGGITPDQYKVFYKAKANLIYYSYIIEKGITAEGLISETVIVGSDPARAGYLFTAYTNKLDYYSSVEDTEYDAATTGSLEGPISIFKSELEAIFAQYNP